MNSLNFHGCIRDDVDQFPINAVTGRRVHTRRLLSSSSLHMRNYLYYIGNVVSVKRL